VPGAGVHTLELSSEISPEVSVHDAALKAASMGMVAKIRATFGLPAAGHVPFAVAMHAQNDGALQAAVAAWHLSLHTPQNARLKYGGVANGVQVVPSVRGQAIEIAALSDAISTALQEGKNEVVATVAETEPVITTADAESLITSLNLLAGGAAQKITLHIASSTIAVPSENIIALIQPTKTGNTLALGIDTLELKKALHDAVAPFEMQGKNAQFEWKEKKATIFVPPRMGRQVDWDATATGLLSALQTATSTINISVKETQPEITLASLNNLGINEEIGFGTSDYSGSTPGRIKNIKAGMAKIEGTLIAPGETFSLIKHLLPIDASGGYVEELVIKENKTQPEFGGGLCQIGTTTFRAAMGAGLPIVERHNHSYQVHYYFENGVSGTDATIYDPKPDFQFTNDTGHWITLHTEMLPKNILRFSVWGTRDGRTTTRTIPKILATKPPPEKQLIETTTLPVGKKKCTELAHVGATTVFTYSVVYPDGALKKQDFSSYYKPWGEVCLIGVAATSTSAGGAQAPVVLSPDVAGVTGN
jgi:vancomycin resistance protein YoaR